MHLWLVSICHHTRLVFHCRCAVNSLVLKKFNFLKAKLYKNMVVSNIHVKRDFQQNNGV